MAQPDTEHPTEEYYPTVSAVIIHEGKVLLRQDRQRSQWLTPSTHIAPNETPLDALFRHVRYETGLTQSYLTSFLPYADNLTLERDETEGITQPLPFDVNIHQAGQNGHYHVDSAYILISSTDELTPESDTPADLQWFSKEELDELLLTPKITISQALYALSKSKDHPVEK